MQTIKIVPISSYNQSNGVTTYWTDFNNVVLPHLLKSYKEVDRRAFSDMVFSFSEHIPPLFDVDKKDVKVFQVLHNDIKEHIKYDPIDFRNHFFLTHYMHMKKWFDEKGFNSTFIPMSIDTDVLPKNEQTKRIIYFSNIYEDKKECFRKLASSGISFDVLSFGMFNNDYRRNYTHSECLDIVSKYQIGIGVGRSALEMLGMGLKVIVAGKEYGGLINNTTELKKHWETNFNSKYISNSDFIEDLRNIDDVEVFNVEKFNMSNFINNYLDYFQIKNGA
jgi:hypothetical protein